MPAIIIDKHILQLTENGPINLELGCGYKKQPGFIGLDNDPDTNPDILWDLEKEGYIPLPDNSVKNIYAMYLFEHIANPLPIMAEVYRICIPNAVVQITVPYWGCESAFRDPTHKKYYSHRSWEYFDSRQTQVPSYGYNAKFDLIQVSEVLTPEGQKLSGSELEFAKKHYVNIIYNITWLLSVVK